MGNGSGVERRDIFAAQAGKMGKPVPLGVMDTQLGYWRWKLFRWNDHPNPYRNRPDLAISWLAQFQSSSVVMAELKALLGSSKTGAYPPGDTQAILREIAEMMSSGEIQACVQLCGPVLATASVSIAAKPEPDISQMISAAPAPIATSTPTAPAPGTVDDPQPTLSANTDAAAMAQALKEASQSGVPFCEECAKAAAAQAVKPNAAPPAPESGDTFADPDASARALKTASQTGAQYCDDGAN